MIDVQNFHKSYGSKLAVDGVSFQVEPGQILGLVGPNGAGKTTTLRSLAGLIVPSQGRLRIAGFDVEKEAVQAKQRLAYVPDDPQLFDDLNVAQHMAFTAKLYGIADSAAKSKELLELFSLHDQLGTRCRDLSRGMRQKLAVCCAYLHSPSAILFDEPLTGLDPPGIRNLKQTIASRARAGAAVIISSHLLAMVEDLCTHVMILQSGKQRFYGTVAELRETFGGNDCSVTLEQIFFQATEMSQWAAAASRGAEETAVVPSEDFETCLP
ncbi:MAG: ABC transporter ATP-binding protein [Planctomycetales bacterium]|nr:ABC transporter ATP-binding protein [Planctomycetales bacterium]